MSSPAALTLFPVLSGSASVKAFVFPDHLVHAAALLLPHTAVNNGGKNVVSVSQRPKRVKMKMSQTETLNIGARACSHILE